MKLHKLTIPKQIIIAFMSMMIFSGCQEEFSNVIEPNNLTAIRANDNLAELVWKVVMRDGSYDNIIDKCSEISVKYPYSIKIKEQTIEIRSLEDIESIKLEYFKFRNGIRIDYPVTVIFSDYSREILSNEGDLKKIQKQYKTTKDDPDIECVDFIYPMGITQYNTTFQKSDYVVAEEDKDVHKIFSDLDDLIVAIDYPVQLKTIDGVKITVNDNVELENMIRNFGNDCQENDEVEFEDEK